MNGKEHDTHWEGMEGTPQSDAEPLRDQNLGGVLGAFEGAIRPQNRNLFAQSLERIRREDGLDAQEPDAAPQESLRTGDSDRGGTEPGPAASRPSGARRPSLRRQRHTLFLGAAGILGVAATLAMMLTQIHRPGVTMIARDNSEIARGQLMAKSSPAEFRDESRQVAASEDTAARATARKLVELDLRDSLSEPVAGREIAAMDAKKDAESNFAPARQQTAQAMGAAVPIPASLPAQADGGAINQPASPIVATAPDVMAANDTESVMASVPESQPVGAMNAEDEKKDRALAQPRLENSSPAASSPAAPAPRMDQYFAGAREGAAVGSSRVARSRELAEQPRGAAVSRRTSSPKPVLLFTTASLKREDARGTVTLTLSDQLSTATTVTTVPAGTR